ncbi:GroES-like protein [Glarea lozoyensis ATCC 20868]|uniref:GroES-like protein n=1 Tax=Glarea lozoyensis (strain ATCC 20868 / MF5171) TaxID=1116229 RepID=S3E538_GLAL2|nr:GroES-like protein [Glarea lozoyensis ATCC 20868]EPE33528.1 GroES-like protein [Glarea lozoyensis ATCC 20868]
MKGISLDKPGGEYSLIETIEKPVPGKKQVLVKSLVTGLNPVEGFQYQGLLVDSWPIVVGCDASGTVVEVGDEVTKFKKGDGAFSCSRLGAPGRGTFQEYLLLDEALAFKRPANVIPEEAATIGVGLLTASLAFFSGLKIPFEPREVNSSVEWVLILGAAGAVGQFAIQLAKLCGYKVLAFCSPQNNELIKKLGADSVLSHKDPPEEQLKGVESITKSNFSRIFDASAMAGEFSMQALAELGEKNKPKYFATTNDWAPVTPREGIDVYIVELGEIGKSGNTNTESVNGDIESFIPKLETLIASGAIKPMGYEQVGDVGVEEVLKGLDAFKTRKSDGKKLIVKLATE